MTLSIGHVGALALGLIAQAFVMLSGRWQEGDFKKAILALSFGLLGMLPGKNERNYDVSLHVFFSFIIAAFSFTMAFASRLITHIGARTLLLINALVILVVFDRFGYSEIALYILLVPTLFTVLNGFTNFDRYFGVQVFFYLWFCTMLVIIGIIQFALGDMLTIMGWAESANPPSLLSTFFMGGALMYILSNAWFVLYMVPITRKHQSFADRMINIRKHIQLLASGYIWQQGDIIGNVVTIVVFPLVLIANHIYGFIDTNTLIFIVLSLIPFTIRRESSEAVIDDNIGTLQPQN